MIQGPTLTDRHLQPQPYSGSQLMTSGHLLSHDIHASGRFQHYICFPNLKIGINFFLKSGTVLSRDDNN